jgi:hypothetical protein
VDVPGEVIANSISGNLRHSAKRRRSRGVPATMLFRAMTWAAAAELAC